MRRDTELVGKKKHKTHRATVFKSKLSLLSELKIQTLAQDSCFEAALAQHSRGIEKSFQIVLSLSPMSPQCLLWERTIKPKGILLLAFSKCIWICELFSHGELIFFFPSKSISNFWWCWIIKRKLPVFSEETGFDSWLRWFCVLEQITKLFCSHFSPL